MRSIERALENIRSVIEQQETEWLEDNGYEPIPHKPEPKRAPEQHKPLSGKFSAGRFLGTASPKPEPLESPEPEESAGPEATEPEIVHVLPQKDNHHSWLYNEVVKAIHDAAGDAKNTKIIAVFIPVVQNGHEFEDLPVSASVELSPVSEEDVRVEELVDLHEEPEQSAEPEPEEPEILGIEQVYEPPEVPVAPEPELEEPEQAEHVDEIVPEPEEVPDPELAEAFSTMEEKLDEHIAEQAASLEEEQEDLTPPEASEPDEVLEPIDLTEDAPEIENIDEILTPLEPESAEEPELVIEDIDDQEGQDEPDEEAKGEPMTFTEIPSIPELDDDDEILSVEDSGHQENIRL